CRARLQDRLEGLAGDLVAVRQQYRVVGARRREDGDQVQLQVVGLQRVREGPGGRRPVPPHHLALRRLRLHFDDVFPVGRRPPGEETERLAGGVRAGGGGAGEADEDDFARLRVVHDLPTDQERLAQGGRGFFLHGDALRGGGEVSGILCTFA